LVAFVTDLKKAIADRDQKWITQALADDAESGFDSENSKTAFIYTWSIDNDSSDFWLMVSRVINMGGIFLHDTADHTGRFQFVFPYAYAIDLNSDDEYYNIGLITGNHVNLRATPDLKSKVVALLNYDMVRFMTNEPEGLQITSGTNGLGEPEWYKVETYGKDKRGWISWKFVYTMMGPRLFLYKEGD
ncbi:MAG: SH3 domain-containing protein, partial [Saprospiraceae bacterium]